jgi:serine/threonine protein phosphatase PrpC
MRTLTTIAAAGETDPGHQREVNEDRFHIDDARGLFIVIDGVGGQAAGGKAADVALAMVRERLERETGPVADRIREAIAIANNEIYRLAASRPEWDGMACVLTIAVVKHGKATIGHVGDTRLYKLGSGGIDKITRDHSPVGEREDASEISEVEAMRHPRRNEVYRDVGSDPHAPDDSEFIDIHEIPFDADEALLLCSDGLTDLVDSACILHAVTERAGDPRAVVRALIDAANAAGGKDNVTAVYIEGENFRASRNVSPPRQAVSVGPGLLPQSGKYLMRQRLALGAAIIVTLIITTLLVYRTAMMPWSPDTPAVDVSPPSQPTQVVVRQDESIAAALSRAQPGAEIVVEPGEYRERLTLNSNVRLISRVPRGATIRLPVITSDAQPQPAVIARGASSAELVGFKIVGDARTPLGVGILVAASGLSLIDIEVSGAATAAISFDGDSTASVVGSDIHDNPGAALAIEAGATPRISHNVFSRNGLSPHTPATITIEKGAAPHFHKNVFVGMLPDVFAVLDNTSRVRLKSENWFLPAGSVATAPVGRAVAGGEGGRPGSVLGTR